MTPPALLALAGLAGLALGSCAVTAGLRFARAEGFLTGRSHCDGCGRTLSYAQTIPVASYVWARGACRSCGGAIDRVHLAGELSGLLIVVAAAAAWDPLRSPMTAGLGLLLVAGSAIDAKIQRIPNLLTAGVAALALGLALTRSVVAMELGIAAALIALTLILPLREVSRRVRGDPGLGLGDVKLIAALALWLGAFTPWMILVASTAGLVAMAILRPKDGRLAYGPMLAAAGWTVGITMEWGLWPTTM
jgi:leader peptidase (prepilin peptidase)/N-methyltransferase